MKNWMSKEPDYWESDTKFVNSCEVDESENEVRIPLKVWQDVLALTQEIDTEWLGYFKGKKTESRNNTIYEVESLIIPEQTVTGSSVEDIEEIPGTIGVVHSHANMSAFFSGTDNRYINSNNDFSIVVNKNNQFKGKCKVTLPCGAVLIKDVKVIIGSRDDKFIKQAKRRIKERVYGDYKFQSTLSWTNSPLDRDESGQDELYEELKEDFFEWLYENDKFKELFELHPASKSWLRDKFKEFLDFSEDETTELANQP